MVKIISSLLLLNFYFLPLFGQDTAKVKTTIGIGMGSNQKQIKDYCLNKTLFNGFGLTGSFFLQKKTTSTINILQLNFTYNKIKNRYDFIASSFNVSPNLSYTFAIKTKPVWKLNNYLGAKLSSGTDLSFYTMWDDSHIYWLTNTHISLYYQSQIQLRKNTLKLSTSFPLLASVSRPPSRRLNKMDKRDADYILKTIYSNQELQSLNSFQNINLRFKYQYRVGEKLSHAIEYTYNYTHNNKTSSKEIFLVEHQIKFYVIIN